MTNQLNKLIAALDNPTRPLPFKSYEQRLSSGDSIVILTNPEPFITETCGKRQEWYRFGALDLATYELGYYRMSTDDISAISKVGHPVPPFAGPCNVGFRYHRAGRHGNRGRFFCSAELVSLPEYLTPKAFADMRRVFDRLNFNPKDSCTRWIELATEAQVKGQIEQTILDLQDGDTFKRADLDASFPEHTREIHYILAKMRRAKRIKKIGNDRNASYRRTVQPEPKVKARKDWES